ncbi:MAG TPA: PAS domain S-box protein [Candidatus Methanoperedens sp.]|nr:PAS domain S-box protein [Candidatus Methanoperedens sp.]
MEKNNTQNLQQTVRFSETLLCASADGILITDSAKNIIFVNDTFCKFFSSNRDYVIQTNIFVWLEKLGSDAQVVWKRMEDNILEHGIARGIEFEMKAGEGMRYFTVNSSLLEKGDIQEAGVIISIWRDDTQSKMITKLNIALKSQINERKQSEDFAFRRNRQLRLLSSAGQKINTVLEIPAIMQNLVASAIEITDATSGSAGMVVNGKMVFSKYYEHDKLIQIDYSFEKGYGVPGMVMETRSPYFSNDAEHDPYVIQEIRKTLGFTNLANVPILDRKGDILGSFQVHNPKGRRPFDQLDIEMLQGLASSAAVAIENARMMDEIRRSEEDKKILSSILDKSLNEIYMFDAQTLRFTYVNSGACKNLNYSQEALRSMTPLDLKPEFDKESFHKLIEPLMQHEKNKIMFYTSHRRSDGSLYPVEVHLQLIEKPSKVFLSMITDITERSRMEKDLKLSEEKYRTLYETMAQGVVYHDSTGEIISVNPAAQKILGLSINHLLGRTSIDPAWKAIHEDGLSFPEKMHPSMVALRTRKKVSDVIMGVFNPREKQYRWIIVNAVPQSRYAQTKPYQVYSTFIDITNIKQAEEEIQAVNMELMTMNRLITAATGILDIDKILETVLDESMKIVGFEGGSICLLNPDETLQLTVHRGLSEAMMLDLTANKVKVGECLCGESARVMKPLILPDPGAVEKFNTREASFEKNIRYHAAFPIVTSGKCVGVLCVFTRTDKKLSGKGQKFLETITAQVALSIDNARLYQEGKDYVGKLEKKVAQRTFDLQENQMSLLNLVDDMNRATDDLESANKRLLELDRMKSMFIASTSHELRTPLNSIIGFTSILLEGWSGELTPEQREQVRIVNTSGKHLLSLINDVIDISKIEAGRIEKHVSKFNLKEVIDEVVSTLKPDLNGRGLLLNVEAADLYLNTDRKRLLQCLMNLLSNAVKFTEKGEIKVGAKSINNEIEISVEDTGIGMKKEDIPKIFTAFVRLDSPLTNKTSGTGLGLYLTQKLAKEVLMGTIAVESEWGKGSIFSMRIPQEVKI